MEKLRQSPMLHLGVKGVDDDDDDDMFFTLYYMFVSLYSLAHIAICFVTNSVPSSGSPFRRR